MPRARNFPPLKVRLLQRADVRPGHCWLWTGSRAKNGYGRLGDDLAHRLAHEEFIGPIPEGLFVLHRCDTPACMNPEHLVAGTARDNSLDMVSKERHGGGKLTRAQVDTIRARHEAGGITQLALAREYGVTEVSINNIVCRRTWVAEAA
jgi:hypothetical protein